jgi:hypothetical protein
VFLLEALKMLAKASMLKGNRAGDELLATARDLVRQAKQNPSRPIEKKGLQSA